MKTSTYKRYKRALITFAKGLRISIVYGNTDSDGVYMPSRRKVVIADDMEEADEIATILHELGHALDDMMGFYLDMESINNAYKKVYSNKKATYRERRIVIMCETAAWRNGRALAKQLKIRTGKWYDDTEAFCLKDYREN